ncbi:hypothetical protein EDD17DRAFT_1582851 [Pisolithus thermaeus]|nr:hypothetical protein EDD17DRAFT_1582851 [Pisolithus thermaeus]
MAGTSSTSTYVFFRFRRQHLSNPSSTPRMLFSRALAPHERKESRKASCVEVQPRIRPVFVNDLANGLLKPSTYISTLSSRCYCGGTLYWSIATMKRDVYGDLIQLICILVPPMASFLFIPRLTTLLQRGVHALNMPYSQVSLRVASALTVTLNSSLLAVHVSHDAHLDRFSVMGCWASGLMFRYD